MKRIRYLPLLWLCLCHWLATAQTFTEEVTALQYYYDTDPGVGVAGNGGVIAVTPAAEVTESLGLALPAGISSGIHFLYIRAKDTEGRWGLPDRRAFFVISEAIQSDEVTALQYYFDTDPGVGVPGNGGIVSVTPGAMVSTSLAITLPPLSAGMHQLYIRARDEHGKWGIPDRRALLVAEPGAVSHTITQLQYYVDADPGVGVAGNGAIVDVTPDELVSTTLAIDVTDYAVGFHQLYVRAKDIYGRWSIIDRRPFIILSNDAVGAQVVALQYYFDTDPGVGIPGNGGIVNITPSDEHTGTYAWELPALNNGMHQLYVRAKNVDGTWGEITRHAFYVLTNELSTQILALEYYFDNDPGVGNGNPIAITPTAVYDTPLEIGVPCLSTGTHYAYLRAKDEHGHWSIIARDTLTVTGGVATAVVSPAGPVTICTGDEIVLSAAAVPGVSYQWLLGGSPIAGATTSVYTAATAGAYALKTTCGVAFTTSNVVTVNTLPLITYYADADADGYGDAAVTSAACSAPAGFVANNTDCDDSNASIHPFATEVCNGIDENCNALTDEGVLLTFYADADGDAYGDALATTLACAAPAGYVANAADCNDADVLINPAGIEACNTIDDNCNGSVDEGVTITYYADADGDAFGDPLAVIEACTAPAGYVSDNTDCNDADALEYPGQTWYTDADADGYGTGTFTIQCERPASGFVSSELSATTGDCNDANYGIHPAAAEVCNGVDENCNGTVDEGVLLTFYADADTDGFGNPAVSTEACTAPAGYVTDNTDCNDGDATAYPGQTYYADMDGDGYGDGSSAASCAAPAGYVLAGMLTATSGDCDDTNPLINPAGQYYTYSGNLNFTDVLVFPANGDSYTEFRFEVMYMDANNGLPAGSYPRMVIDYEGNGVFTDPNDRTIVLSAEDPGDLNTTDGKIYFGTISALAPGLNWTARVLTGNGCIAEFGPFNDFAVTEDPDLELFASDITFSDFEPEPLDEITVFATIQNTAVTPASGFYVRLTNQFDGTVYPDVWVNNLNGGASTTVTWAITTPAVAAWCPMEVSIDPTALVAESNELDNVAVRPFVNGDYYVPGDIDVTASVSPSMVYNIPGSTVTVSGHASYIGLAVPLPDPDVAGAQVTLTVVETGAEYIGYTNASGYFTLTIPAGMALGTYHITGEVTDFTLTGDVPELTFQVIPVPEMPDLVTIVTVSDGMIIAGESIDGTVTVTNIGNLTTGAPTQLDVSQSGGLPVIGDAITPVLTPGASFDYDFYGVTFNTPGIYTICGTADAGYAITEWYEWNNTGCAYIHVLSPMPDLYGGGSLGGGTCDIEPAGITLNITNGGVAPTGDFESKVFTTVDGVLESEVTFMTSSILPGQTATVSLPFVNYGFGSYSYTVDLDHAGMITEASDINNDFSFGGVYTFCLPDLKINYCNTIEVETDDPIAPATLDITVSFSNAGDGTAVGPIPVEIDLSDGSSYLTTYAGNLAPGAVQSVPFTIPAPVNGTLITAEVNPFETIVEETYANNDRSGTLCWDFGLQPLCIADFWEHTYVVNSYVYPAIAVHAYDLYQATNVPVRFELQGPGIVGSMHLGDAVLAELSPTCGSCGMFAAAPNAYMFLEPGIYTCTMTVDPDHLYSDCEPVNNVMVVNIHVTGDADMVILSEYIHPSELNPAPGESISFNITYANNGFENVGETMNMQLFADDILLEEIIGVPGLMTGDNNTIAATATWSSTLDGAHVIKAMIDAGETVTESNEDNNTATRAVIVGASANPGLETLWVSNPLPAAGEMITIYASVYNTGVTNVDADVYLYYVTDDMDTINIAVVPIHVDGYDTMEMSHPWMVMDPQTTIIAEIRNASVVEFDYSDNTAETQIGAFLVSISVTHESCMDVNDGSVFAVASGGQSPYLYQWNTGAFGQLLAAEPGTYTVTVTDNTGMSTTATATIDASLSPLLTYYADADMDAFGDAAVTIQSCTGAPAGYISDNTDCNDGNASINPAATEVCNGLDDDCDGSIDEGVLLTFYADADGDGFGDAGTSVEVCSMPAGYVTDNSDCDDTQWLYADADGDGFGAGSAVACGVTANSDCNDSNAAINPSSTEVCNGLDDDCDGSIDEGVLLTFYADADGDGFGDAGASVEVCSMPSGYVADNTDCDDTQWLYADADGDGFGAGSAVACGVTTNSDCNDGNASINPSATEVCNGLDDDCDGSIDEGVLLTFYADADGDGFGDVSATTLACAAPSGYVSDATDCNDSNASINPLATELCNGLDDDCDGSIDEGVLLTFYADADGDGFGDAGTSVEVCSMPSGYVADNTDCDDTQWLYADADGDGFGAGSAVACGVTANSDCNDSNAAINPSATEVCNGLDDDCDGSVDEGVLLTFYADADGDGFGDVSATTLACTAPVGYVSDATDCNDGNAAIHPAATEVCNGIDDNCNGSADEGLSVDTWYADADGDGFGNADESVESCSAPSGYVTDGTDCNDTNAMVNPGAVEIAGNGIDDDCDGVTDPGGCSLVVEAGANESTYFGLTVDQTVTRSASITGGVAPYSVVWTLSRPLLCNVVNDSGDEEFNAGSCTNNICPTGAVAPVCTGVTLTAKLIDTAVVYVTVTDAAGCVAVDSFIIYAEDVRCFAGKSGNYKIRMCHMTGSVSNPCVTICIDENAVDAHLAHGDGFGYCNPDCTSRMTEYGDETGIVEEEDVLSVYPNPSSDHVTVDLHTAEHADAKATILLVNTAGAVVATWDAEMQGGLLLRTLLLDDAVAAGVYSVRVIIGDKHFAASIVVTK